VAAPGFEFADTADGHDDRPSHGFVLDAAGTVSDVRHYAEVFVPLDQLLADLDLDDRE
jgi:hypothetical protein